ncbi:MAG: 16S rRNA (cytosine(967)-C(5))-methyltransferase RsmB [Oscillospiraceae bacterium]|nr:16S rRNA (cytosine(967)-C(5))-methyltransferase RsmB [Oscillospiraceae bacterium]
MNARSNPRAAVAAALGEMENGAYSNIALSRRLNAGSYTPAEKAFAARLFYGVIERKLTLDYIIARRAAKSPEPLVKNILRAALYELAYMNSSREYAVVDESVKLCKTFGKTSAGSFVNAVLRGFIRAGKRVDFSGISDRLERLSVEYSCGRDVLESLIDSLGEEETINILQMTFGKSRQYIRANTMKISPSELSRRLCAEGIACEENFLPGCVSVDGSMVLESLQSFREGLFHVQDLSSQICASLFGGLRNSRIFDLCAAPGGKSFTIAQLAENSQVFAFDIHDFKIKLIREGAERLGLSDRVNALIGDAAVFNPETGRADAVLCDVPCSGLGVAAKKPEIKYKSRKEYENLPEIQLKILNNAAQYLEGGGLLVYSSCTLLKNENQRITERFERENPDFPPCELPDYLNSCFTNEKKNSALISPETFGSDGFYISAWRKKFGI